MNSHQKCKILIAEDDADDRLLIEDAFTECDLTNELEFVVDGVDLLDHLNRRGKYADLEGEPLPNLILLDLNMPRMDGRTALKQIKTSPELCKIPVVVLTTSKAQEDIVRTYGLGVNSFITKPVTFEKLVDVVGVLTQYWECVVTLPAAEAA